MPIQDPSIIETTARYRAGTARSHELWTRASGVFPDGVSGAAKYFSPYPVFLRDAHGARAVDVDGNEYVDYCIGFGPMLLGHGPPEVIEAVREQLARMFTYGAQQPARCRARRAGPRRHALRSSSSALRRPPAARRRGGAAVARAATGRRR